MQLDKKVEMFDSCKKKKIYYLYYCQSSCTPFKSYYVNVFRVSITEQRGMGRPRSEITSGLGGI